MFLIFISIKNLKYLLFYSECMALICTKPLKLNTIIVCYHSTVLLNVLPLSFLEPFHAMIKCNTSYLTYKLEKISSFSNLN